MRYAQITDTHLLSKPGEPYRGWDTQATLEAVLADCVEKHQPDALLLTGDLVHDEQEPGYIRLRETLDRFDVPHQAIPGNHDNPAFMGQHLNPLGHTKLDAWQLIGLSSHVPGEVGGHLADPALAYLDFCLGEAANTPALIAVHHPPIPIGSEWMDNIMLANGQDLLDRVIQHTAPVTIICGHIHQELVAEYGHVRILGTPSTCRQFLPRSDEFAEDTERRPGYRILDLGNNGHLETQVYRIP